MKRLRYSGALRNAEGAWMNMEALPPNHRDLSLSARIAGWRASPASACSRHPGPEPALELLPSSALSSTQVFTAYPKTARLAKSEFTKTVNHVPGMKCKRCSGIDRHSCRHLACEKSGLVPFRGQRPSRLKYDHGQWRNDQICRGWSSMRGRGYRIHVPSVSHIAATENFGV